MIAVPDIGSVYSVGLY